jgi:hypothetical protein
MAQAVNRSVRGADSLYKKLFAHITCNGIINQTSLEGHCLQTTLNYAAQELKDTLSFGCGFSLSPEESQLMERMSKDLDQAVGYERDFIKAMNHLDEEAKTSYCHDFSQSLLIEMQQAPNGHKILLPGGYFAASSEGCGHAMLYELEKTDEGQLLFHVFNTGNGLECHPRWADKYYSRITLDLGSCANGFHFTELLAKVFFFKISKAPNKEGRHLYENIFADFVHRGAQYRASSKESLMSAQKSGICAYHVILSFQKNRLSQPTYKTLRLYSKIRAFQQFFINDPSCFHPHHPLYSRLVIPAFEKTRRQLKKAGLDPHVLLGHFPKTEKILYGSSLNPKHFFSHTLPTADKFSLGLRVRLLLVLYWLQSLSDALLEKILCALDRVALIVHSIFHRLITFPKQAKVMS